MTKGSLAHCGITKDESGKSIMFIQVKFNPNKKLRKDFFYLGQEQQQKHHISTVIRRRFFPSKIILKSNFGDCFKNVDFRDRFGDKNYFKAKLHKTELNIWCHS